MKGLGEMARTHPAESATRGAHEAVAAMPPLERVLTRSAWVFYAIIVFEILFMISPFALYFYSAYRPVLDRLDRWAWTAWLTQFFLPHFSETTSRPLHTLHGLASPLLLARAGLVLRG